MNKTNKIVLADWKKKYSDNFKNCNVLELGSADVNGSVREFFENCKYIGVDKRKASGVDIVCEAKNTRFWKDYFDTLISFSMIEHDPDWKESLKNNIEWLRKDGLLMICYGAEGNNPHYDGGFHIIVSHKKILSFLKKDFAIIDNFFEEERYKNDCPGAYYIIARKCL